MVDNELAGLNRSVNVEAAEIRRLKALCDTLAEQLADGEAALAKAHEAFTAASEARWMYVNGHRMYDDPRKLTHDAAASALRHLISLKV